jgi:hypothetical protein
MQYAHFVCFLCRLRRENHSGTGWFALGPHCLYVYQRLTVGCLLQLTASKHAEQLRHEFGTSTYQYVERHTAWAQARQRNAGAAQMCFPLFPETSEPGLIL